MSGTGGSLSCVINIVVTGSGDLVIGGVIALITGLVCVPAYSGTGRSLSCVINIVVTGSGNSGLSYESLGANRAVRALGKTCLGTSGSNCLIGNYCVTLSGNSLVFSA